MQPHHPLQRHHRTVGWIDHRLIRRPDGSQRIHSLLLELTTSIMTTIMADEADEHGHNACVDAWMARVARGLAPEPLLRAFERGFVVLWRRAHQTLGDVTLAAIMDRVLYTAVEQFPLLSSLAIEATGIKCEDLVASAGGLDRDQLAGGIRFVMTQFLTILGNLTSEILTPALHSELSKIGPDKLGSPAHKGEDTEP